MNDLSPLSVTRISRIAGLWYLALALFGGFGIAIADGMFLVPGDAAATAAKLRADELLFRLGIASNLIGQVCFVLTGLWFYRLFEGVHKPWARTLLTLVVTSVPIAFLNTVFKFAALLAAQDAQEPLALLFLNLQAFGTTMVSLFWGLWLLPLGWLTWKSGFLPKVFGVLLLLNGGAYVADSLLGLVFPAIRAQLSLAFSVLLPIGEIPFLLWILIRGARVKTPA